jgi:hypothetical protein
MWYDARPDCKLGRHDDDPCNQLYSNIMHDPKLTRSGVQMSQAMRGAGFLLSRVLCSFSLLPLGLID